MKLNKINNNFVIFLGVLIFTLSLCFYRYGKLYAEAPKQAGAEAAKDVPAAEEKGYTTLMFEYFDKGGSMMWGILFSSIVGFGVCFERGFKLRVKKMIPPDFVEAIRAEIPAGNITKAIALCEGKNFPIARILKAGLLKHNQGVSEVERALESAGSLEIAYLSTNFGILRSAITMAPMLGFLGTVTGMIASFQTIATMGSSRPDLISAGIAEALITTAYGLLVAVPLMFIYQIFKGRVDTIILQLQEISLDIVAELSARGEQGAV